MDLDFTVTDEWQGLSKQEQQQHLFPGAERHLGYFSRS